MAALMPVDFKLPALGAIAAATIALGGCGSPPAAELLEDFLDGVDTCRAHCVVGSADLRGRGELWVNWQATNTLDHDLAVTKERVRGWLFHQNEELFLEVTFGQASDSIGWRAVSGGKVVVQGETLCIGEDSAARVFVVDGDPGLLANLEVVSSGADCSGPGRGRLYVKRW
jgi:hypothetical protein